MNNRNDSSRSPEESHERRQDFDDSANELWSLYGKEAKIHDKEWIKALKEDMGGVLIFVCASFSCLARVDVALIPGWFIFCCSHRVRCRKYSESEGEPRGPVSLLPEPNCSDA